MIVQAGTAVIPMSVSICRMTPIRSEPAEGGRAMLSTNQKGITALLCRHLAE